MGLIVLSIMLSVILGCSTWLILGEKFPLKEEDKWPVTNHIVCYSAMLIVPVYLVIFFVF
jgi:hypothetical protein